MSGARGQIMDGSQEGQILAYLCTGAELTPLDALQRFGCLRLGARIFALRQDGVSIVSRTIRSGRKAFAAYRLAIPTG
jgi:hypothetical protein